MALYRKHGTNPFASCFPILIQMPIFFALFRVLANLQAIAEGTYEGRDSIGPLTADLANQVQHSTVFGASLSSSFMNPSDISSALTVKIVTVIMIIAMSATQWYTMAQLSMKNMPESSKNSDNPMMRSQRMMMTIMPLFFAFTGVQFQIGVLIYWVTSNLWTMGQQFYTIVGCLRPGRRRRRSSEPVRMPSAPARVCPLWRRRNARRPRLRGRSLPVGSVPSRCERTGRRRTLSSHRPRMKPL